MNEARMTAQAATTQQEASAGWIKHLASLALVALIMGAIPPAAATETVTYYATNAQGTVVATMDSQGNPTYTAAYRPYGKQVQGTPQAGPGYTGHVNDPDSGLVYMQKRYYDADIGRFPSPDPIGPTPGNIFSFNRYAYANGNPIANVDPTGMSSDDNHSSSSCGSDIPPATCKKIRQQQKENKSARDLYHASIWVAANGTSSTKYMYANTDRTYYINQPAYALVEGIGVSGIYAIFGHIIVRDGVLLVTAAGKTPASQQAKTEFWAKIAITQGSKAIARRSLTRAAPGYYGPDSIGSTTLKLPNPTGYEPLNITITGGYRIVIGHGSAVPIPSKTSQTYQIKIVTNN